MIPRILALALLILSSASQAEAALYLHWRDGSVTHVPDEMIMLALVIGALACLWFLFSIMEDTSSSSSVDQVSLDLPEEVRTPESVEYYDDMTERTRALKRKLDADTELAESYIGAARARAELEEIDETDRLNRRINGRR
jgi:hypothetical protein